MRIHNMLKEIIDIGVMSSEIGRDAGASKGYVRDIFKGCSVTEEKKPKIVKGLKKRLDIIKTFNPDIHDVKEICERTGIPIARLGKELGMSRQAAHQFSLEGFPENRIQEIKKYFNKVADILNKAIKELR